jgi:hypothetical protein
VLCQTPCFDWVTEANSFLLNFFIRNLFLPGTVAAQMLAVKPSRRHDDMLMSSFSLRHPQFHHSRTCLGIIVL